MGEEWERDWSGRECDWGEPVCLCFMGNVNDECWAWQGIYLDTLLLLLWCNKNWIKTWEIYLFFFFNSKDNLELLYKIIWIWIETNILMPKILNLVINWRNRKSKIKILFSNCCLEKLGTINLKINYLWTISLRRGMKEAAENNSTRRNKKIKIRDLLKSKSNFRQIHAFLATKETSHSELDQSLHFLPYCAQEGDVSIHPRSGSRCGWHFLDASFSLLWIEGRSPPVSPVLLPLSLVGGAQIAFMRELRADPSSAYTPLSYIYIPLW